MIELAEPAYAAVDFAELFSGRTDAYGTGRGRVVRERLGIEQYAEHLRGEGEGLGVFPMRDDNTVLFAAVDLDRPDFELARTIDDMLPGTTFIERTRSGNAHIWVFFESPIAAWIPRGVMRAVLNALGEPMVEVFPKQDELLPGMVGNYINLPYFGESRPVLVWSPRDDYRYEMALSQFTQAAVTHRQDPEEWRRRAKLLGVNPPSERGERREFGTDEHLHICAEYIVQGALSGERPVQAGHRSVVYFNLAKQLLMWERMDEDQAWELLQDVEAASPDRISQRELRRFFDNANSGRWTSYGCDDPVMAPYTHPDCPIANGAQRGAA